MPASTPPLTTVLAERLTQAVTAALGEAYAGLDPELRPATRPEFGHYQTNLALRLAKPTGRPPRELAETLREHLELTDLCEPPEIAEPGFLNLTLRPATLAAAVTGLLAGDRLGVPAADPAQRVVVDYSSPNVAREMHVGHLRSTVIGDSLARVLAHLGHDVVRANHLGDWGTQFGMLIEALLDERADRTGADDPTGAAGWPDLAELGRLYQRARTRFDDDPEFAERSRRRVVSLQSGDRETTQVWRGLVAASLAGFDSTYARLGALLTDADIAAESSYNDVLPGVIADLDSAGLLHESDGALVAFPPGFSGRDGGPLALIVRKSDGGFGYVATDLAAVRRRVDEIGVDRIVYVVDVRQSLHFDQVFALARLAGWLPQRVRAEHVGFGMVLGEDGRPFKTRSGENVRLATLLDEAVAKAAALLDERGSQLPEPERTAVAAAVGIGAVKWADLSNDLGRDYIFSLDRMVAMDGNTGPYLQYAHARLATLLRRADAVPSRVEVLEHPVEQRLALALTRFGEAVDEVGTTLEPHRLCTHLFGVAATLSSFYEACPVLRAEQPVRASRLALCDATRRVLATGLDLLGIVAPDRM
jgi:arginyl-tRNA synthetase